MPDITNDVYPQKAVFDPVSRADPASALRGPARFKFGEGAVFMRPGRVIAHALDGAALTLTCETRGYVNRTTQTHETRLHQFEAVTDCAGQLNIEIRFWSPDIFRVRFSAAALPQREPDFPDAKGRMLIGSPEPDVAVAFEPSSDRLTLKTSQVELRIDTAVFALQARDTAGQVFWQHKRTDLFTADIFDISVATADGQAACFESFTLDGQEDIYGLGERFDHVPRAGRTVDFWNKDAIGTSNRRTYINVPFFWSTRGYGCFVNSSCRAEWEIGTLDAFTAGFAVEDGAMDYFIIHGPQPADILARYASLTGFSPTPPVWSFGLWMSRNSYESWDVVHDVARGMRQREIPADVLHLDTAWFQQDWNCDLRFSTDRFAEPEEHMRRLREEGFRISLWQYNFVPPRADNANFVEGMEKGYFVLGRDGRRYAYPEGATGSWVDDAIVDFSNPEAATWYAAQIQQLIRLGAATIKTDFGEGIPEDGVFRNADGRRFHNLYTLVYNATIAEAIREVTGEHIVWARSGTAGSQRYPIHWGGDSQCSWGGLAGTLRAALSIGLSGFPFFSHDIGGFIGRPAPELYIRWAQFGLFSSHARCHGAGNDNSREPWSFGEEATRIFKKYAQLRYRLLPYLVDQARKSSRTAKPIVRALVIDYPDDPNLRSIQDEYLFGDCFLVAPVLAPLSEQSARTLYLPRGIWVDYWTRRPISSRGEWVTRPVDLDTLPIYVKAGSIIPYGRNRQSTYNEVGPIERLEAYRGMDGELRYDDGVTRFTAALRSGRLEVRGLDYRPAMSFI